MLQKKRAREHARNGMRPEFESGCWCVDEENSGIISCVFQPHGSNHKLDAGEDVTHL
jgi:hypothetical protein